jgi:hypothetical protein
VKEVVGNVQGKQLADAAANAASQTALLNEGFRSSQTVNPNFPQPYYQATGFSPSFPSGSGGIPHRPWPGMHVPNMQYTLNTDRGASGELSKNVIEQVARTLRELGLTPRGHAKAYQKPYPKYFDMVPYPKGFRVPDFVKFMGVHSRTTYEYIGQFLAQVSDAGITDVHRVKLFPLSLSRHLGGLRRKVPRVFL